MKMLKRVVGRGGKRTPPSPPVFSFERTLKRPDLSPRAAEYGLAVNRV